MLVFATICNHCAKIMTRTKSSNDKLKLTAELLNLKIKIAWTRTLNINANLMRIITANIHQWEVENPLSLFLIRNILQNCKVLLREKNHLSVLFRIWSDQRGVTNWLDTETYKFCKTVVENIFKRWAKNDR